jgi:hypothetical protein
MGSGHSLPGCKWRGARGGRVVRRGRDDGGGAWGDYEIFVALLLRWAGRGARSRDSKATRHVVTGCAVGAGGGSHGPVL